MIVIKRNGEKVEYDLEKISIAIAGAFNDLKEEFDDEKILDKIDDAIQVAFPQEISVEDIQDIVEEKLCESGYINEARAYIRYRYIHELARQKDKDIEVLNMINGNDDY